MEYRTSIRGVTCNVMGEGEARIGVVRASHAKQLSSKLRGGSSEISHGGAGHTVKGRTGGFHDVHNEMKNMGFRRMESSTDKESHYEHLDGTTAKARKTYDRGEYKHTVVFK